MTAGSRHGRDDTVTCPRATKTFMCIERDVIVANFVLGNSYWPRLSLPLKIFVHYLGLFLTLIRRAGINRDLLPVRRTVQANHCRW